MSDILNNIAEAIALETRDEPELRELIIAWTADYYAQAIRQKVAELTLAGPTG